MTGGWLGRVFGRRPRPNVVWVCADDYTPAACSAYGSRVARTPHLARLAAGGVRFDNAFCTCPLSTPSRQSFWTGRYPRSIGVTLSPTPLPDDEVTLPVLLRRAGYETAGFGKTHFYHPRPDEFDVRADYPDYERWRARRPAPPAPGPTYGEWRPFLDPGRVWLNADVLPQPSDDAGMFGTYLAEGAARYLGEPKARPFFLYVSFYETHAPFAFPVELRGLHAPSEFAPPPVTDRLPPAFRDLTTADRAGILAAYHTSAAHLDANVGRVLSALDASPHVGTTLVIFTSDHGYFLGQGGRFEKHSCLDPAIRSCLLVRWPGVTAAGRATAATVSLFDLTPTVLEACGARVPSNVQAASLVRLLAGRTDRHRDRVFVEYADNEELAVRTDRWKLIYSAGRRVRRDGYARDDDPPGRSVQLFDLAADPGEETNLADRPEAVGVRDRLLRELAGHAARTARDRRSVPRTRDPYAVLDATAGPRDEDLGAYLRRRMGLA